MDENNSIQLFEDRKIRTAWDEEKEEWYFSVVDVIAVLTDQPTARSASTYWAVLKKRLKEEGASELLTNCKQLKMRCNRRKNASNGRCQHANSFCASSSPSRRPRQNRSGVGWLRSAGNASRRPSTRSRPSTGRWRPIRRRAMMPTGSTSGILSIRVRNELTAEWQARGVEQGKEYAILTDEITKAWSGMTTRQYKNLKGLKKENLRDNMSTIGDCAEHAGRDHDHGAFQGPPAGGL